MKPPKSIGFEIKVLSTLIKRSLDDEMLEEGKDGLTGLQGWIIGYVVMNKDRPVFQRDLEKEFSIRRATVSGILQLMERNELIRREPVDYDARLKKITLTPKAFMQHERVMARVEAFEQKLRSGLSEKEIAVFFELADKLKRNLE